MQPGRDPVRLMAVPMHAGTELRSEVVPGPAGRQHQVVSARVPDAHTIR